jgi:hypothetical protein
MYYYRMILKKQEKNLKLLEYSKLGGQIDEDAEDSQRVDTG